MMQIISLIVVAVLAGNTFADKKSSGTCPGGYDNGAQMDIGRYWYECKDGQVVPKGCLTEDQPPRRVEIDGTYDTKQYRMKCQLGEDGFLTVIFKACMLDGAEHDVGSQWDDGTAFFTCVKAGSNVRVITLGCVDQGRPLKIDERVAKGDTIFQCRKSTDGTPTLNKVGCVFDGKKYNIGETIEAPKAWYTCTDSGAKIMGCMYNSHKLQGSDHIDDGDVRYSCRVNDEETFFVPFACLQREENGLVIERRVGCFWVEGNHEYTCKDGGSRKADKVQTQCVYFSQKGGAFKLRPGCARVVENQAIGCLEQSGKLTMQTYSADLIDSLPGGLRQC